MQINILNQFCENQWFFILMPGFIGIISSYATRKYLFNSIRRSITDNRSFVSLLPRVLSIRACLLSIIVTYYCILVYYIYIIDQVICSVYWFKQLALWFLFFDNLLLLNRTIYQYIYCKKRSISNRKKI